MAVATSEDETAAADEGVAFGELALLRATRATRSGGLRRARDLRAREVFATREREKGPPRFGVQRQCIKILAFRF